MKSNEPNITFRTLRICSLWMTRIKICSTEWSDLCGGLLLNREIRLCLTLRGEKSRTLVYLCPTFRKSRLKKTHFSHCFVWMYLYCHWFMFQFLCVCLHVCILFCFVTIKDFISPWVFFYIWNYLIYAVIVRLVLHHVWQPFCCPFILIFSCMNFGISLHACMEMKSKKIVQKLFFIYKK